MATAQQARAIGYHRLYWPAVVSVLVVLGAATIGMARLSTFMLDETRVDLSVMPKRPFFRTHSCLSCTPKRRASRQPASISSTLRSTNPERPGQNMPRMIGPFEVDYYQYPPTFLILPRAAVAAGLDFLTIRRLWFAIQAVVLFVTMVMLAKWIGGSSGLLVLLLVPVTWLSQTIRLTLQIGNFQLTAFALTVLAMIAFERGRAVRGGLALGFPAASKVFPGLLGVLLIVERQWRAVAWTVAWAVAFTAAAWLVVGSVPFVDFFRYQLPRIESGQAFFWMENADAAAINYGIHGLVIKLRFLGLPWTGPEAASRAASLYAVLLVPLSFVSAWRLRALASHANRSRAAAPPQGAGVARPPQPGIVPKPVRSRRVRTHRHALAGDASGGRGPLADARADRPRRRRRDSHDGPRRRPDTGSRSGMDHGRDPRRPSRCDRVQRGDCAYARPGAARRASLPQSDDGTD